MNIYQRIVLFLGAAVLVIAIWTSPRVIILKGFQYAYKPAHDSKGLQHIIEPRTALMRSVAIVGATVLVFFALKSRER